MSLIRGLAPLARRLSSQLSFSLPTPDVASNCLISGSSFHLNKVCCPRQWYSTGPDDKKEIPLNDESKADVAEVSSSSKIAKSKNVIQANKGNSLYEPLEPEAIPDDFFTSSHEISDDEFYSMLLLKNLKGVPGLPPPEELRAMDSGAEEKAVRREMERVKQEEIKKARVQVIDAQGRAYATGKRKCSTARVWISPGDGRIIVNGKPHNVYFPELDYRTVLLEPFSVTSTLGNFNVRSTVRGGGRSGQSGAMRHGISKALQLYSPELRPALKAAGFLTRDSRVVERKKPGKAKARKSFQWVKR